MSICQNFHFKTFGNFIDLFTVLKIMIANFGIDWLIHRRLALS